jgi:hypothetical protein
VGFGVSAGSLDAPGFKGGHGAVFDAVMHFYGMTADFAILNKPLAFYGYIQHHGDLFPAIRA